MTEKEMQNNLFLFLEKKFKKAKIIKEYPFIHGTADILMKHKNKWYIFELKLIINNTLFKQAIKHKLVGDYLICIAYKPSKESIAKKWKIKAKKEQLNLLWVNEVKKNKIKKLKTNKQMHQKIRSSTYGI